MVKMTRREFLQSTAAAGSLLLLSKVLPGCGQRPVVAAGPDNEPLTPWTHSDVFGVTPEDCRQIMSAALARGGDFAEIYFENTTQDNLSLEEGIIRDASASTDMGAGIRVVVGDQVGYAYTEDLSLAALKETAATAALIAHGNSAESLATAYKAVKIENRFPIKYLPTEWPIANKIELLRRVDKAARAASSKVEVVLSSITSTFSRIMIVRSDGQVFSDSRPRANLFCMVTVRDGERTERNYYYRGARSDMEMFNGDVPEEIAREAVRRAEICLEAITPPAGEMPVVLAAADSGMLLHEAIGHGLEADFNRKNTSLFSDKMGQRVASELCTIVDDGTINGLDGSVSVDDEGTPSHRTTLIDKGILVGYMHDRISARHYGVEATGNGKRQSFRHQPMPRMTNTLMLNGPFAKEELYEGVERGIYAISFTNGQVNIGPGDYTFFVNFGYLIENGKLTAPIKDVNLIGNGPKSLSLVDRVANDYAPFGGAQGYCGKRGQRVSVSYGLPSIRVSKMTVGGRG